MAKAGPEPPQWMAGAGMGGAPSWATSRRRTLGGAQLLTGWEVVTEIVAPHLEANVGVRIAPKVRPHSTGRKTDGIRISGARGGTATLIHPVWRLRSAMDGHDFGALSRETR